LVALAGCSNGSDVLDDLARSQSVDAVDRATCEKVMDAELHAPIVATTRAPYEEVREATATRLGDRAAEAPAPLDADTEVTLCAMDVSEVPSTPQVDHVVLAVEPGGSSWWADGDFG